jgi:hypothetical protein
VNDRSGDNADKKTTGRGRRPGLLMGAVALAATASLATIVFVQAGGPSGTTLVSGLAASVNQAGGGGGTPAPTDSGKGKGTPTPTDSGKGKGKGTPTPTDSGKGKGKGTPAPTDSGKGKGKGTPTPTPTGKGKGSSAQPETATLAEARQFAGFPVRTLDGLPGAQLQTVSIYTITFDTAPGQPSRPTVELRYLVGQMQVSIVEVRDPLDAPPATQTYVEELPVGGSHYVLTPRTGLVNVAQAKEADGVSIVVNFFDRSAGAPTGADRQVAYLVVRQLG